MVSREDFISGISDDPIWKQDLSETPQIKIVSLLSTIAGSGVLLWVYGLIETVRRTAIGFGDELSRIYTHLSMLITSTLSEQRFWIGVSFTEAERALSNYPGWAQFALAALVVLAVALILTTTLEAVR